MRFYEPQRGQITIDGTDLSRPQVESLHRQVGIVTQENFLFTGTVMENLKFGRPEAADDDVIEAAKTLGTHEMIMRFAEGYQTKVSERGGNFSAGERQLLTFTRAMVARPRILILDEATERRWTRRRSGQSACAGATVRSPHMLSLWHTGFQQSGNAHCIFVLSQGEIIERGDA
jgi:ATP-binding cassette subfamily B protein